MGDKVLVSQSRVNTILDLFCGCGGFSHGFKKTFPKAGFTGVDYWKTACNSYERNIGQSICMDMKDFAGICEDYKNVDLLIISPPCPDFSCANKKRKKDPVLIELSLEIRDRIKPRYWIMEEVQEVGVLAEKMGWFKPRYLKACEFGLPHERKRLFAGNYPEPIRGHWRGKLFPTPTASQRGYHQRDAKRTKLHFRKFFGHPWPTVDDYKKLMGFPEDYYVYGNKNEQFVQLGNAVCPPVSAAIARAIKYQPTLEAFMK
jgi:site-specific DNA-cytosine methylase